ncbi:MAG: hypothetical protein H8M99_11980 [Gloeobacteraceae cyanobacterium ES-bin-144]|nr:hypothetical protein [Verrucomicrobiales bacterium]
MKKSLRHWAVAAVGTAIAIAFTSCTYDPYYTSVGGSYNSGYGGGGGGGYSTSLFVSTGDARWGYDPSCYSYYDYSRRCYYDPYLYGYYPVGYRPPVVYGVPHPYGWNRGRGYCPPPRNVRNVTVVNYRNREAAYRNSNYSWSSRVRQSPQSDSYNRSQSYRENYRAPDRSSGQNDPRMNYRRTESNFQSPNRTDGGQYQYRQPQSGNSDPRSQRIARPPASYRSPVNTYNEPEPGGDRRSYRGQESQRRVEPSESRRSAPRENQFVPQSPQPSRERSQPDRRGDSNSSDDRRKGFRSLGEG